MKNVIIENGVKPEMAIAIVSLVLVCAVIALLIIATIRHTLKKGKSVVCFSTLNKYFDSLLNTRPKYFVTHRTNGQIDFERELARISF